MPSSIAITGCSVVTPRAMTLTEFADRAMSSQSPDGTPSGHGRLPLDRFDPQRYLGPRGFKYLTPATQYALAAAQMALDDARFEGAGYAPHERAVVVGTNFGVHAVLAGMDRVILDSGAQQLRPMEAPNFSVNIPASHLSMKHKFTAFNVTLTTAQVAGLEAVLLAVDALRAGRARVALVCATEGEPPEGLEDAFGTPLAEGGACALVLELLDDALGRGADVRGEIWGGTSRFVDADPGTHGAVASSLLLEQMLSEVIPPGSGAVHVLGPLEGAPFGDELRLATRRVLERAERVAVPHDVTARFGECASVSPLLQVLAMCASRAGQALVTAVSLQGHVVVVSGCGHGLSTSTAVAASDAPPLSVMLTSSVRP